MEYDSNIYGKIKILYTDDNVVFFRYGKDSYQYLHMQLFEDMLLGNQLREI